MDVRMQLQFPEYQENMDKNRGKQNSVTLVKIWSDIAYNSTFLALRNMALNQQPPSLDREHSQKFENLTGKLFDCLLVSEGQK